MAGCDRTHEAQGLCGMHYQRLKKTGTLDQPLATGSDEERFWAKVDRGGSGGCWLWCAGISSNTGYGNVWWYGKTASAHRVAYQLSRGPILDGLTLDHLCRVRHCVNPDHLEAVPFVVNNARGTSPSAINKVKTHCVNGHEFTSENTYRWKGRDARGCRVCRNKAANRATHS